MLGALVCGAKPYAAASLDQGTSAMAKDKSPKDVPLEELGREDRPDDPLFVPHLEHETMREAMRTLRTKKPGSDEYARALESICGATDDSQPVEQYNGNLGVTQAFVNSHQAPVGQLQWNDNLGSIYTNPGNVSGVRWCTGTMISNDLFLSAGHCFDQTGGGWERPRVNGTTNIISNQEIATRMHVNFNFQVDPSGNPRTEQSFPVQQLLEYRLGNLDFAICRLGGNPGQIFGFTPVSTTDAAVNDMLCIIGHPAGMMKRIEAGPCTSLSGNDVFYNDIDTLGGNSGSGILRAGDGQIIGVHTNGGCNAGGTGSNRGVRITSIRANSPTLQNLGTGTANKFLDDIGTNPSADLGGGITFNKISDDGGTPNKALDDGITLKFSDDGGTFNKFRDDGGTPNKFLDDGVTIKAVDDGGTLKFADDGGGTPSKAFDDVKTPGLDKGPSDVKGAGNDGGPLVNPGIDPRFGGGGARPFVLATPHHSQAFVSPVEQQRQQSMQQQMEAQISALEQQIAALHDQLQRLDAMYRQALAQYAAMTGQTG
jgi:V8-like Glu-specific endopeptidase